MPKFCVLILRHGLGLPIHQVLSDLGAPLVISVGPDRIQAVLTINIAAHQHRRFFLSPVEKESGSQLAHMAPRCSSRVKVIHKIERRYAGLQHA